MIDFLKNIDTELFLLINGCRSEWADVFFWWVSDKYIWIPFYAALLFFMIKYNRKHWYLIVISIPLLVTATDQISVQCFKDVFQRLRPCHCEDIKDLVQIVNGKCGGKYGFISSHAANCFGIATFVWLVLRKNINYIGWVVFVFYAALVSYSRVYLGVHYPGDVSVGAALGVILGFAFFKLFRMAVCYIDKKIQSSKN